MEAIDVIRILVRLLFLSKICYGIQFKLQKKHLEKCVEISKDPYFDVDIIIGKPWRIYYTWNVQMGNKCLDITFKNATSLVTNRIYNDMHEYLEMQPAWDAATLYSTLGTAKHELLLFADLGPAGRLLGVPNVIKDGGMGPLRRSVPLLQFYIKLLHEGRYLLMMDCNIGVASLSSRERPPYRAEVATVANTLPLSDGAQACVTEKKPDEEFSIE